MALRFYDGFELYSGSVSMYRRWQYAIWNYFTTGRFGSGQCVFNGGNSGAFGVSFDNQPTWIVGFGFRPGSNMNTTSNILRIQDNGTDQVVLRRVNSGDNVTASLQLTRGGTVLATSTIKLSALTWYWVELKVTIDPSAGSYTLKVGTTTTLTATGVNTRNSANSYAQYLQFETNQSNDAFDDLYILDGTGGSFNDFLGEVRVGTLLPTGNGSTNTFTASAGTNVSCVQEATANDDTNYVSSPTAGAVDLYTIGTPQPGTIQAVQVVVTHRKDDAGARQVRPALRRAGTTYDGTAADSLPGYLQATTIWTTDPSTGAAWTAANVAAAEIGAKVV